MTNQIHTKVLIIGSGPAGYTSAIYAARASLEPVLVTGLETGGQLMITTDVENFPGFAEPVSGPWLMDQMKAQAESFGTKVISDVITIFDSSQKPCIAHGDSGNVYTADTVIICTGAQAKWLGLETETAFRGMGVSGCATCDGFFYRGKEVAVIGGGNTAVEEAMFLSNFCPKVYLVHRRNELRADKIMQQRLTENEKIEPIWDSIVEEVLGVLPDQGDNPGVTGLRIKNVKTGEEKILPVNGMFVAIGHIPATEIFKGQLDMDEEGYIITAPNSTKTGIPGIFAAGDVRDKVFRQAVTAAGTGCMAAIEADRYLIENG
jgi:thioredoxin reductase (NADPH)